MEADLFALARRGKKRDWARDERQLQVAFSSRREGPRFYSDRDAVILNEGGAVSVPNPEQKAYEAMNLGWRARFVLGALPA
jgi:hypothetical protein